MDSQIRFLWTALVIILISMVFTFALFGDEIEQERPVHECVHFEKKSVRRMITPMTFMWEDALVCTECGREYKN